MGLAEPGDRYPVKMEGLTTSEGVVRLSNATIIVGIEDALLEAVGRPAAARLRTCVQACVRVGKMMNVPLQPVLPR